MNENISELARRIAASSQESAAKRRVDLAVKLDEVEDYLKVMETRYNGLMKDVADLIGEVGKSIPELAWSGFVALQNHKYIGTGVSGDVRIGAHRLGVTVRVTGGWTRDPSKPMFSRERWTPNRLNRNEMGVCLFIAWQGFCDPRTGAFVIASRDDDRTQVTYEKFAHDLTEWITAALAVL